MKTPLTTNKSADFQSFYDKWVEEFRIQENNQSQLTVYNLDRLWEGTAAFVALTKAGALHNVMPTKEFEYDENLPKYTLRGLYKEVEIYRLYRNRISDVNNKFKDAMEDILQASDRISRMPQSVSQLAASRDRCMKYLSRELETLKHQRDSYWDHALLALPQERAKWSVSLTGNPTDPFEYCPPEELMMWEKNLAVTLKSQGPNKSIDLDTRFQIRIAKALQFYFNEVPQFCLRTGRRFRVPLKTVSRLVVLTYIAAQLSKERNNQLFISGNNLQNTRALTVDSVYQKLRDAGLI